MTKSASKRYKRRKFSGNRFTGSLKDSDRATNSEEIDRPVTENLPSSSNHAANTTEAEAHHTPKSASHRKLVPGEIEADQKFESSKGSTETSEASITGFRLVDMTILADIFTRVRCGDCGEFCLVLSENTHNRKGCSSQLRLVCGNCDWKFVSYTSKKQGKSFEVNRRLVYSMRSIGKGHAGARKFCITMNMPPPPTARAFAQNSRVILKHVKTMAEKSMSDAAQELKEPDSSQPTNCGASFDGTWQRRGHSSLNGCVTAISIETGKVLDVEALTVSCKQCQQHEHMDKDSDDYKRWKLDHVKCKANFKGSAPAMEPEGTDRIFKRSIEKHNLRYTEFYGDGDSKSFARVKNTYQEEEITVDKKECIGHVQKRCGTALRKLKRDNPGMGGKGKLTDAQIDRLQNYYGIAIRSNVGNKDAMKKAIYASLFHCASNDQNCYHDAHCPPGTSSWCKYQKNKADHTNLYKHGSGFPLEVIAKLKPIYEKLSEDSLLEKCLHGKTQNQNECLNGMIWQRVPKEVYVGRDILELGLYDAVAHFNMGAASVLRLLQALNIEPGKYTLEGCRLQDVERVHLADRKEMASSKKRRRILRGKRKRKNDKTKQSEGTLYAPGEF